MQEISAVAGGCLSCGYFYVREKGAVNAYSLMCGSVTGNRKWKRMAGLEKFQPIFLWR